MRPPINPSDLAQALGAGLSKSEISFATVDDEEPVSFDPDLGPLVNATLGPSGTPVVCRVGMSAAGKGEADYYPFAPGDELLVAIPHGEPRGGGVVLARLCNRIDAFPETVGGRDATKNEFAFRRTVAPRVEETDGPVFLRHAPTGAFLTIGETGAVTLRDGSKGALQLSAEALSYVSGDGSCALVLDLGAKRLTARAGGAAMVLGDSGRSSVSVPGSLALATAGQPPAEHVLTAEAMLNILGAVFLAIGTASPGVLFGAALAGLAPVFLPAAVGLAATPASAAVYAAVAPALYAVFAAAGPKPPPVPGQGQLFPGLGCAGLTAG